MVELEELLGLMAWFRVDDQFFAHPKARAAGKDGRELYIAAGCYAASMLTDGKITAASLPLVAALAEVKQTVADDLVDVGLWERTDDGYQIHDFNDYNPRADKVRAERAQERDRKAKARGTQSRGADGRITSGPRPPGRPGGQPPDKPPRPPGHEPESGPRPESVRDMSHRSHPLPQEPSSSPSDSPPGDPQPVEEEEAEQGSAVDVLIRAACELIAIDELRSFQIRKPDQAPPSRSDREDSFVVSAKGRAWQRLESKARALLAKDPHLDPHQLAAALAPASMANATNHEDLTGAAAKRIRDENETRRAEDERLAEIERERRARAEALLAEMSTDDRKKLLAEVEENLGPGARPTVIASALRAAVLERQP